jgi:choline kinase
MMNKPPCKRALILAAGRGTRVRSLITDEPKCLIDLGGRPIIAWILDALAMAGIQRVTIVTGFGAKTLRQTLGKGRGSGLRLDYVHNRRWREPNGLSLYAARRALGDDDFLTLMSDHLLPPSIIRAVARARTSRCMLAADTHLAGVFDISDATKVRLAEGRPVAIGKRLRTYNAVDCGLFRFDRRIFTALETAFRGDRMALTDGVRVLMATGDLDVLLANKMFWIDIDTPKAYRQATKSMSSFLSTLNKNKRSSR